MGPDNLVTRFARNNDSSNPYLLLSKKKRHPCGCLFSLGRGIRIRTLNDGVRGSQSFFKTAYLSHFSDFASLKNLSEFYFCLEQQIRMRNCEPYIEVSKNTYSIIKLTRIKVNIIKRDLP